LGFWPLSHPSIGGGHVAAVPPGVFSRPYVFPALCRKTPGRDVVFMLWDYRPGHAQVTKHVIQVVFLPGVDVFRVAHRLSQGHHSAPPMLTVIRYLHPRIFPLDFPGFIVKLSLKFEALVDLLNTA
jgi:hypothetical protein